MTSVAPDTILRGAPSPRTASGLGFALASAASFGLSESLAKVLMEAGWSSGAAVAVRVLIGALVLAVPAARALRGRWRLLRDNAGLVLAYGALAVAGCQLFYFNAVAHMEVGLALLIEYTAPVLIVGWLWLRHGQRPGVRTVTGALLAAAGMVLVLDVVTGAQVSPVGVAWAFGAAVGAAVYFLISADEGNGLPPIALAAAGLVVGAAVLLAAGAIGILPMHASTAQVTLAGATTAWWVPLVALGVVTAAVAYTTGVAASRRLGSRLASFVALGEVLMALLFAWALLGELPRGIQLAGGVLVLVGVVVVKLGESEIARR